jgi:S-adenosylmethionine hydrolase
VPGSRGGDGGRGAGHVFLLTDYGYDDEFAGVLRTVLAREAPRADVVDISHGVPAFDVRAGALMLERTVPHLGPGVVVAVVDPGVGTARRAVAASVVREGGPRFLVGPDNGLLAPAIEVLGGATRAVALRREPNDDAGATFDGRDVFAPAAASLWCGESLDSLGEEIDPASLVRLEPPVLSTRPGEIEAEVLWIDRFGNVQLSASPSDLDTSGIGELLEVTAAGRRFPARASSSFSVRGSHSPEGAPIGLIVDSNGRLSLVCERRSAATVLGVSERDVVTLRALSGSR